jgi:hypothetical protein
MAFQGQLKMTELKLRDAEALIVDKDRDILEVPLSCRAEMLLSTY